LAASVAPVPAATLVTRRSLPDAANRDRVRLVGDRTLADGDRTARGDARALPDRGAEAAVTLLLAPTATESVRPRDARAAADRRAAVGADVGVGTERGVGGIVGVAAVADGQAVAGADRHAEARGRCQRVHLGGEVGSVVLMPLM
jgi:hypothetical protein